MKYLYLLLTFYAIASCSSEENLEPTIIEENIVTINTEKDTEPLDTTDASNASKAIPIYNQAYQENFKADKIDYIKNNAKNGYVLLDPLQSNIKDHIANIKSNNNEVGAYMSIGTGETYREDYKAMQPYLVSTSWSEWSEEYFVNATTTGILELMKARIDKIAALGFDWVEFDNMDWIYDDYYRSIYNFQVTEEEGIAYYQKLCDYVHSKGMKCMAKNTVKSASDFDGVLYESYNDNKNWWIQSGAQSFLDAGKLVIVNHYNETNCGQAYSDYKDIYNENLSFICEDANLKKYVHFNK